MNKTISENSLQFLSGGGEMGKLIRSMDWSATALGPVTEWPQSLRTSVSLCLSSTFPILIAWGPETIQIYNDSYRPICGAKHPESMGQNFRKCWETALEVVGEPFTRGQNGEGSYIKNQRMYLDRYDYLEEAFMTFSFAPIHDETGGVGGIFHPITETTENMLSARRTHTLRDLGSEMVKAKSVEKIALIMVNKYKEYAEDLPFVVMYKFEETGKNANLVFHAGLAAALHLVPESINIEDCAPGTWPVGNIITEQQIEVVNNLTQIFGDFNCEPYPEAPKSAVILPIRISGKKELFGFLIAGVSSRRSLDAHYLNFYELLGNTCNTALSTIYAHEQEQKRAEALAEIDRSKTSFFSNVSHEFRTPLTLMLGPLEELLKHENFQQPVIKESVESIHRNSLRLLKLVNNLLDYSRIEAGRMDASFELVDLAALTKDLSSSFRSIIENAGLTLIVNCKTIKQTTYVDKQMWEKIVLNLLSNAFNYTLAGTITISLKEEDNFILLQVEDTGIGIPAKELPAMFQRFHRVQNAAGRTALGAGIGLSLVNELVQLHKGTIAVKSTEGMQSIFSVKIPSGKEHLPPLQVFSKNNIKPSSVVRDFFIKEAYDILRKNNYPQNTATALPEADMNLQINATSNKFTTLLIVDDNDDMRTYLGHLLDPYFKLYFACNGKDAIEQLKHFTPHLILSDMMMPVMDGKGMLKQLKENPLTIKIPVIFLSARAGEEARIDGLEAGADDYLVKPFSAAELLTKIRAQIKISQARAYSELKLRNLLKRIPVGIVLYSGPDFTIEMINEKTLEYWDKTEAQTLHKKVFEVLPELKGQGFHHIMEEVYKTGCRFVSDEIAVIFIKDGDPYTQYMNLTLEPIREENNEITGLMAVGTDVTAQVLARKELEKITYTLNLALDGAGIGTWSADLLTGNLVLSERTRIIHSIPEGTLITLDQSAKMINEEHRKRIKFGIEKAIKNNQSFDEIYAIFPLDGSKKKWLRSAGKAYYNEHGEAINIAGTIIDITEQKEDELRKNDFIGMVSHELKTPLTSLNGYAQILQARAKQKADGNTVDVLDKILNQVKKMSTMINGFLNVSRLESGKIHLNKKEFNMNTLIEDIMEDTVPLAANHHLKFIPGSPAFLYADRDKIGSVISNLLSNAIKYTPAEKDITVTCKKMDKLIVVNVIDEGFGIKAHDAEKLFQRYYRVENINSAHISGFGIGLYLSAEIIQHHGGKIGVDSQPGKGATFYFTLPATN